MDGGGLLKAETEDQMEMMIMMMEMEKLANSSSPSELQFSDKCTETISPIFLNYPPPYSASPTVANNNSPSSVQYMGTPVQQPMMMGKFMNNNSFSSPSEKRSSSMAAMREMIFRIAAMQPVHIDPESVKPPKRRNVKISKDPQSVAARHRRERISERIRILQRLVPGGTKMDTAAMLDEAIHYVKFLKKQVQSLEQASVNYRPTTNGVGLPAATAAAMGSVSYSSFLKTCQNPQMVGSVQMLG